jgi:DeoR/GlpR family transcriptional regulator of sugar metabolism
MPETAGAAIKSAAVQSSRRRIFVGAHTKFGVSSFARFAGIADFDLLITGRGLSQTQAN